MKQHGWSNYISHPLNYTARILSLPSRLPLIATIITAQRHIGGTALALCLLLGACSSSSSDWRRGELPPPDPLLALDAPRHGGAVLASRFLAPPATALEPAARASTEDDLMAFFEDWRKAWMKGDFKAYMGHYALAYSGNDASSLRWQIRHLRMVQGKSALARLHIGTPTIEIEDENRAQISFPQEFHDAGQTEIGTKQWQLLRVDGRWLIKQEVFEYRAP